MEDPPLKHILVNEVKDNTHRKENLITEKVRQAILPLR